MLNKPTRTKLVALALVVGAVTAAWAATEATLSYNGNVVSHGLRTIDGKTYVPLTDVARMVHGAVVQTGDGYEIKGQADVASAGGANQVGGLTGKIGQMLFTGKWRFEVTGVTRTPQFSTQYEPTTETVTPTGTNDDIVVVACIVKNGVAQSRQIVMRTQNAGNTSVTDDQEQAYPPVQYDFGGGSGYGPTLLPGSAQHFNVCFDVPKTANLKDLVFTLTSYEDNNPTDVRVSLAQ